jgi:hypothetical protein
MSADVRSRAQAPLGWQEADAAGLKVSRATALPIRGTLIDRAFLWLFIAGLAWCPFWFGSNVLLAWGVNAVLFPGLCLLYEISRLVRTGRRQIGIGALKLSAGLFLTVLAWIFVQNATWTPSILHHPIWAMAAKALDTPVSGSISVDRDLTTLALIRLITAASVFWLALHLCRDRSRAQVLLRAIAAIGCGYAAYGLVAFALTPGWVLWVKDAGLPGMGLGIVRSTFINRNSYATYAGIGLITICGLILQLYRHEAINIGGSWRFRIANFIEVTGRKGAMLIGGAFVIFVALLMTGSRGGAIATSLGLFVLGVLTFGKRKRGAIDKVGVIGFGAIVITGTFLVFGDAVVSHISHEGLYDEDRMAVYLIVIRSIFSAPVLGYGYGTFEDVFPMYRDHSIGVEGVWTQAHNTYVEIFQGLGLIFGAMLIGSVLLLVGRCLRGSIQNPGSVTVARIATGVAVLIGVHALVDFSLQMQAVAITFMAVLGAGVAQSENVPQDRPRIRKILNILTTHPAVWIKSVRFVTAIAVIAACGFAAVSGWHIMCFSLIAMDKSLENREERVHAWTAVPGVAAAAWKIVLPDLKATDSLRDGLSAVLSIKPLSSPDWLSFAGLQLSTNQPIEAVVESFELSLLTGPNEGEVMAKRGIFGVSVWDALPAHLKDRTVRDLVVGTISSARATSKLGTALSAELERVRSELRTRLLAEGLPPKDLKAIGF